MKANCRKCHEVRAGLRLSEEQMTRYCQECKQLKRLEDPGMTVLPVYELETLLDAVTNNRPIIMRSGLLNLST